MATIPAKVSARLTSALKRFQPILSSALARDINESDTMMIVTDIFDELFGYEKIHELTSEHQIRGTFCDLAVMIEGKLRLLVEVKAIGLDLKEKHLRQAVNYAANQGLEWVVLTNAVDWQVHKLDFSQPISWELTCDFNLLELKPKSASTIDCLYLLSREGLMKGALPDHYIQKQATSRHVLGALILSDPVVKTVRRELKRLSPDIKVSVDQIRSVLEHEVLKREVVEGEKAEEAKKKVSKAGGRALKTPRQKKAAEAALAREPSEATEAREAEER
jgi:hypothetical protein